MMAKKDESVIPPGEHCYRVYPIRDGEVLSWDHDRFGKDLREFSYGPGFKEVLCPYWRRTEYGTVKCEFLGMEVLDNEINDHNESVALLAKRIGLEAAQQFPASLLADEIKECDIRYDEDDPWCYDD